MQEEVRDKSVALVIKVGKTGARLTASMVKAAMRRYLEHSRNPSAHHGRQTVKQLIGQGAGVKSIEITDKNIKSFEHVARKYGVDFALKKDVAEGKYFVFFKGRDSDAIEAAFAEYTAKTITHGKDKPSLSAQLSHFKEVVAGMTRDSEKNRQRGGIER